MAGTAQPWTVQLSAIPAFASRRRLTSQTGKASEDRGRKKKDRGSTFPPSGATGLWVHEPQAAVSLGASLSVCGQVRAA